MLTEATILEIITARDLPIFSTGGNAYKIAARRIYEAITIELAPLVELHRREAVITCPEECWCWDAEAEGSKP